MQETVHKFEESLQTTVVSVGVNESVDEQEPESESGHASV